MQVERLEDDGFINWLWDKYQLHKKKIKVQKKIQDLALAIENKTFNPGPDVKLIGTNRKTGEHPVHIIKDSPSRQWALLMKELRDIERKERGGFHITIKHGTTKPTKTPK